MTATLPPASSPALQVRRIDPSARAQLLDEIRRSAHDREAKAPPAIVGATSSSSSWATLPPTLEDALDLDKEYIRACVQGLVPLLVECYDSAAQRIPHLEGSIVVDVTIEGEPGVGSVISESRIDDARSDLTDPALRECIQETMYALDIDPPASGGVVRFIYPFVFKAR